jgi:hypothetical protein
MAHAAWKSSLALAFLLMALGATAPARAQQECSTTCSRYEEGNCVEHTQTCSTPSYNIPSFGAIAYGRESGAYGYSFQWNSQAKAESVALQNCAKNGRDCEVIVWFDRRCGAVAASTNGSTAYWGIGETIGAARATAISQCTKDRGRQCEVKASQCSR